MKQLALSKAIRTIALLITMAAAVVPLYSQQTTESEPDSEPAAASPSIPTQPPAPQSTRQTFVFPTRRQRFDRYVKSTVGPSSLAGSAIAGGIDQWRDHPDEWEQGAKGYGKRYASDFGRNAIQQSVVYGLDSALGLDTKFRRSTRKAIVSANG